MVQQSNGSVKTTRRGFLGIGVACLLGGCTATPSAKGVDCLVWGRQGLRAGEFLNPRAVGVHRGEVYVVDKSGRVQVFDEAGQFARQWELPNFDNGTPTAITFDDDRILVPDTHYSRVLEYDLKGTLLGQWGVYGNAPGQFIYPTGLTLLSNGEYAFSEYGENAERIQIFDAQHGLKRYWGHHGTEPGAFNRAMAIQHDQEDNLWVADTANHRVQVFTPEGELLRTITGAPDTPIRFPHDIALAPDGDLYVAEYGRHCISCFDGAGAFITAYGTAGRGLGEFNAPRGVALSPEGVIFVADTDNHRIQRLTPVEGQA